MSDKVKKPSKLALAFGFALALGGVAAYVAVDNEQNKLQENLQRSVDQAANICSAETDTSYLGLNKDYDKQYCDCFQENASRIFKENYTPSFLYGDEAPDLTFKCSF